MNLGDLLLGATTSFQFSTSVASVPTALVGGTLAVYEGSNTTPITLGLSLSTNFASQTGNHNVTIVGTTGNGYAAGKNYTLYLATGSVGGVTVAPCVLAVFSIGNRVARSAAENATELLTQADGVEIGLTVQGALRLSAAADAGELSGAEGSPVIIQNAVANTKARITAVVDEFGNRSAVAVDVT